MKLDHVKKLSQLIHIGLADLRTHERTEGCKVNMSTWLRSEGGVCYACLAGAVMRHSLGYASDRMSFWPYMIHGRERRVLHALNKLRVGCVWSAAVDMGLSRQMHEPFDRLMPIYETNPHGWWRAMEKLAYDLSKAGL